MGGDFLRRTQPRRRVGDGCRSTILRDAASSNAPRNRSPIFNASRLPRFANGRSLSGNAAPAQLDLAWRTRNSVFMASYTAREPPMNTRATPGGSLREPLESRREPTLGPGSNKVTQHQRVVRPLQTNGRHRFGRWRKVKVPQEQRGIPVPRVRPNSARRPSCQN